MTQQPPHNGLDLSRQQQDFVDRMTEQYQRFADAIQRLNAGVGRYTHTIENIHKDFKFGRAA